MSIQIVFVNRDARFFHPSLLHPMPLHVNKQKGLTSFFSLSLDFYWVIPRNDFTALNGKSTSCLVTFFSFLLSRIFFFVFPNEPFVPSPIIRQGQKQVPKHKEKNVVQLNSIIINDRFFFSVLQPWRLLSNRDFLPFNKCFLGEHDVRLFLKWKKKTLSRVQLASSARQWQAVAHQDFRMLCQIPYRERKRDDEVLMGATGGGMKVAPRSSPEMMDGGPRHPAAVFICFFLLRS